MDADLLQAKFARMGARLRIDEMSRLRDDRPVALDVRSDSKGEFFEIGLGAKDVDVDVLDLRKRERHLLLRTRTNADSDLFLCGHDERHWFVAAVPERAGVSNVATAMEALKPAEVLAAQAQQGVKGKDRRRRKNAAYRRQGEWFFLPAVDLKVDKKLIVRDEPLSRGNGGKPHWAELCYRIGGRTVYVCDQYPAGLISISYQKLIAKKPEAKAWNWRSMRRDATVYVKGRIRHADHATINLVEWHRVVMNTENQSRAMRHVVFLD
jgi:hypothetical protein